ncbi:DeoR/GlpR family DNA-binding transcription regulator [Schaalia sp. Marseille-Q2122]|uniref:DeoR/GlpR family DNA-binding transcription regulator n=1 Tax=Schaalia sp. Marseille-Q2122 TaxID=2736604 RepID=UPI00158EA8F1|nr:DeoR/GlpR family DNA-binding transcription regulator [Schaalia sp. Marseille-Q2122]
MEDAQPRLPAGRKSHIATYIAEVGQVTVADLARRFGVSVDTIRRDLDQLDAEGVLIRTHGGAMSTSAIPWHDTQLDDRTRLRPHEKDTIARLAAGLVDDGTVLLINGGTTTLALAPHLADRRELIIATNSLVIPTSINPDSCRDVYMIGGHVRLSGRVAIGPVSFSAPNGAGQVAVQADLALLGVGAVDAEGGFSTTNLAEAMMIAQMAQQSRKVAILADSSKFTSRLFATIGPLSLADYLVTDTLPPAPLLAALREHEVTVITPDN